MLWAIKALMFTVYTVVGALLVLSVSALFARRWKLGFKRFISAIVAALLSIVAMPLLGGLYAVAANHDSGAPGDAAYSVGSVISTQINFAASGLPVGLLIGLGLARLERQRRTRHTEPERRS